MTKIIKIEAATEKAFSDIKNLLLELYPENKPLDYGTFKRVVSNKCLCVLVAYDKDKIIGMASIVIYDKLGGKVGIIEDVVVSSKFRGKGIGKNLTMGLIEEAKKSGCHFADVNTRRADAKEFYLKLGFSEKNKERPFFALRYAF